MSKQTDLSDFYYSSKMAAIFDGECHTINGQKFTYAIWHGDTPSSGFDDLEPVALAVKHNVQYNLALLTLMKERTGRYGYYKTSIEG